MAQDTNKQERYSSIIEAKLRATSVFKALFNSAHDGTPTAGAVKIPVRAEATVAAYDAVNGGALHHTGTTYIPMLCDKDYYVNELIDGFRAAAVPDNMVAERLDSAGYALANNIDELLAGELCSSGTASTDTTALTKANVYEKIIDDVTTAKKAKVDPAKMWIAVTSDTYGKLIKSTEFVSAAANEAELQNGFVGKLAGIPVYEAINLNGKTVGSGSSAKGVDYVVGNSDFCHFVNEWSVPVSVQDLKDGVHIGASAVQGRQAFGYLISKATTVIVHTA